MTRLLDDYRQHQSGRIQLSRFLTPVGGALNRSNP